MLDYTALKAEIDDDPLQLGYAALVAAGNDQGIAEVLNAPNAGAVTLTEIGNATFVTAFLPYLPNIAALPDQTKKDMYWRLWETVLAMPNISLISSHVAGALEMAVADGILTAEQAAAIQQRQGSRAEVLFGGGTVIGNGDVSFALRGTR